MISFKTSFCIFSFFLSTSCAYALETFKVVGKADLVEGHSVHVEGETYYKTENGERSYKIFKNSSTHPLGGFPVILVFGDEGQSPQDLEKLTNFDEFAQSYGFLVVYMRALENKWNILQAHSLSDYALSSDVMAVKTLRDVLISDENIDSHKIYGVGFGSGGVFVNYLSTLKETPFRKVVSVSGGIVSNFESSYDNGEFIPNWQIINYQDKVYPFVGKDLPASLNFLSYNRTRDILLSYGGCQSHSLSVLKKKENIPLVLEDTGQSCFKGEGYRATILSQSGHTWSSSPYRVLDDLNFDYDLSSQIVKFFDLED